MGEPMERFHIIDKGAAIVRLKNRVHKQVSIYRRGTFIYAGVAGGFVRLTRGGGTDHPTISWLDLEGPNVQLIENFPTYVPPKPGAKPKLVAS